MTEFELSRVYARGWAAGKKALSEFYVDTDKIDIEQANPYEEIPARERWAKGFTEALCGAKERPVLRQSPEAKAKATPSPTHRFQIGQTVALSGSMFERRTTESFKISRLLPVEAGIVQYRIKSTSNNHERVADESRLIKRS